MPYKLALVRRIAVRPSHANQNKKGHSMTLTEKMQRLASLDRAMEYAATEDKFVYALDTLRHELDLRLPINRKMTDDIVEQFEGMLEAAL
jgi:hypothetical protein